MPQDLKALAEQRKILQNQLELKYGLGAPIPITSIRNYDWIEHKPDVTTETSAYLAAKMIFKQTHREATEAEHLKFKTDRQARVEELDRKEAERRMNEGKFAILAADPRISGAASVPSPNESLIAQLVAAQAEIARLTAQQRGEASPLSTTHTPSATPVGRTSSKRDGA